MKIVKAVLFHTGFHCCWQSQNWKDEMAPIRMFISLLIITIVGTIEATKTAEHETDEQHVQEEMRKIMKENAHVNRDKVASALLNHLQNKYDYKAWFVLVMPEVEQGHMAHSGGFHSVTEQGRLAVTVSQDKDAFSKFNENFVADRLKNDLYSPSSSKNYGLLWPVTKVGLSTIKFLNDALSWKKSSWFTIATDALAAGGIISGGKEIYDNYHDEENVGEIDEIHEHFHRYLPWLQYYSGSAVETLVVRTPCISYEELKEKIVATVRTANARGVEFPLKKEENCVKQLVMVVPTKALPADAVPKCETNKLMLRNGLTQGYLSTESNEKDAYIRLNKPWKNLSGQRWRFDGNQLKNDYGKCVTKAITSTYVYQSDCDPKNQNQHWVRRGLHIASASGGCLSSYIHEKDDIYAIYSKSCENTEEFMWYDWDVDCEDSLFFPPISGSRPLVNKFSRRYLTAGSTYAEKKAWSDKSSQYWHFVDGELRNGQGNCLTGKKSWLPRSLQTRWYVQTNEKCTSTSINKAQRWNYNENKKQIISEEGYCLSVATEDDYVIYDDCKDREEQWWEWI